MLVGNMTLFEKRTFEGFDITRRAQDGFFNASDICRVRNKQARHYLAMPTVQEYMQELAKELQTSQESLLSVAHGGSDPGTWVHARLGMNLANWTCPRLGAFVESWVLRLSHADEAPIPATPGCFNRQLRLVSETDLHYAVVSYVRRFHPDAVLVAGLGELQDSSSRRLDAWAKGYLKGQPDILLLNATKASAGLAIEIKSPAANSASPSEAQAAAMIRLEEVGFATLVSNDYDIICRRIDEHMRARTHRCSCCGVAFASERAAEVHRLRKRLREVDADEEAKS